MKQSRGLIRSIVMVPIACIVAVPFYYIVVNTLKTQPETAANPLALPSSLYLGNYLHVFETTPIVQAFANTLYVTVISIVLMLVIGSMAAFGVLIGKGRFATVLGVILVIAFLIPGQSTLIPLYRMLAGVQLVDSLNGLIVMYSCGSIFCYFLIIGYMRTIPIELFEAARIDGAGAFRVYWSVTLPLIRPILVTVGVFQTMWVWNDFITPNVFINSPEKQTLVLQVYSAVGQFTTDWPAFMTLSVIVLIPMVIFFIVAQRQIVSGLVSGSVKG
ncbi:carbohydrate ABC transporter permease [Leifsonia sp. 2MCAF36]|uniref:carbohydrate ABC transporter permease n=1 Tax=Leifsonia sp. 2MCAF36 TaxID=3232988 RepID=UPI003F955D1D